MADEELEQKVEEPKEAVAGEEAEKAAEIPAEQAEGAEEAPPGGTDGTAVYARKEHQKAKRLSEELQAEREARIAAEARAKALEEVAKKPAEEKKQPERRFTTAELMQAVSEDRITHADALEYTKETAKLEAVELIRKERAAESEQDRGKRIIANVQRDLNAYVQNVPALRDRTSETYQKAKKEYDRLVEERGYPDDIRTELLAAEHTLGPLTKFQRQKEIETATREAQKGDLHGETSAGGGSGNGNGNGGRTGFADIPKHMQEYWDRTRTSPENREKEAAIYRKTHPKRTAARV